MSRVGLTSVLPSSTGAGVYSGQVTHGPAHPEIVSDGLVTSAVQAPSAAVQAHDFAHAPMEIVRQATTPFGTSKITTRTGTEFMIGQSTELTTMMEILINKNYEVILNEVAQIHDIPGQSVKWYTLKFDLNELDPVPELTSGRRGSYTFYGDETSLTQWGATQLMEHNALATERGAQMMAKQLQLFQSSTITSMAKDVIYALASCHLSPTIERALSKSLERKSIRDIMQDELMLWDIVKQRKDALKDIFNKVDEDGKQFEVQYDMVLGSPAFRLANVIGEERLDYDKAGAPGVVRRNTLASELFNVPFGYRFVSAKQYEEDSNGFRRDVFENISQIGEFFHSTDLQSTNFDNYTSLNRAVMIYNEPDDTMCVIKLEEMLKHCNKFDKNGFPLTYLNLSRRNKAADSFFTEEHKQQDPFIYRKDPDAGSKSEIGNVQVFGQIEERHFGAHDVVNLCQTVWNSIDDADLKEVLPQALRDMQSVLQQAEDVDANECNQFVKRLQLRDEPTPRADGVSQKRVPLPPTQLAQGQSSVSACSAIPLYTSWDALLQIDELAKTNEPGLKAAYPYAQNSIKIIRAFIPLWKRFVASLGKVFDKSLLLDAKNGGAHMDVKTAEAVAYESLLTPHLTPLFFDATKQRAQRTGAEVDEAEMPRDALQVQQEFSNLGSKVVALQGNVQTILNDYRQISDTVLAVLEDSNRVIDQNYLRQVGETNAVLAYYVMLHCVLISSESGVLSQDAQSKIQSDARPIADEILKSGLDKKALQLLRSFVTDLQQKESYTRLRNVLKGIAQHAFTEVENVPQNVADKHRINLHIHESLRNALRRLAAERASEVQSADPSDYRRIYDGRQIPQSRSLGSRGAGPHGAAQRDGRYQQFDSDEDDEDLFGRQQTSSQSRAATGRTVSRDILSKTNIALEEGMQRLLQSVKDCEGESILVLIAKVYCYAPLIASQVAKMISKNIVVPFGFVVARPHMTYHMRYLIFLRGNGEAVKVFRNPLQQKVEIGTDAVNRQSFLSYVTMFKAAVVKPEYVYPVRNVMTSGSISGCGRKFFNANDYRPSENSVPAGESLLSFLVPYRSQVQNPISLNGYAQAPQSYVNQSSILGAGELTYATAHYYTILHQFNSHINAEQETATSFGSQAYNANMLCFRGLTCYYDANKRTFSQLASGTGHWKDCATHPGCRDGRNGKDVSRYDAAYWTSRAYTDASDVVA